MQTIAQSSVLASLTNRLNRLQPTTARRWGTLTASEMLCHLGDAAEMVLRIRPRMQPVPARERPLVKALGLWTPLRWPHGWRTNPAHDPRMLGTKPTDFERDRQRLLAAMVALARARAATLEPAHGFFGNMSLADWQRWTFKHTDHHLRQFGL